jgi:HrpA-like RNA helicase
MRKYSVIIIDEAHEMSIATELVLKFMKDLIARNHKDRRCPFLFVMSATFDPLKFAKYLLPDSDHPKKNIIRVRGFTYPIEDKYLEVDTENYVQKSVEISLKLHEKIEDFDSDFRDILIFVSGAQEIKAIVAELEKVSAKSSKFLDSYPFKVIRLTGDIVREQSKEYKDIFAKYNKDMKRRIIIGTNVAETGITIDTLKYVIDTGFYKSKEYNPNLGAEILHYKNVSNDMRMQRRGRVGRKNPGIYYGLYTKENVELLEKTAAQNLPEMYKTDISLELLTALHAFDNLDLLNPIPSQLYESTLEKLFYLGLMDDEKKLTEMGMVARKFRFLSIESIKMILSTKNWKYSNLIRIINMASIIETVAFDKKTNRSAIYEHFYGDKALYYQTLHSCDFILLTLIFEKYQEKIAKNSDLKFLAKIGMEKKEKSFIEALKIRDETIFTLDKIGIKLNKIDQYEDIKEVEEVNQIKRIIYEGYKLNIIYDSKTYKNVPIINKVPQYFGARYIIYKKIKFAEMQRKYTASAETLSNFDGTSIDYQIFSR